jgi:hypothetical protein
VCLLVTLLTAATSCAQPDGMFGDMSGDFDEGGDPVLETTSRRYYSAFPRIMTPRREWKSWQYTDGTKDGVLIYTGLGPRPVLPVLASAASALQKVRSAQLREGLSYPDQLVEVIRRGAWSSQFFRQYANLVPEMYRLGAELEEQPAQRVRWHEAGIRKLKEFERFQFIRTVYGSDPPQRYDYIQFVRYGAEIELLKLLDEVNRTGAGVVPFPMPLPERPGAVRSVGELEPAPPEPKDPPGRITPTTTAFPKLTPGTVEIRGIPEPGGVVRRAHYIDTAVIPPRIPVLAADAPPLSRLRHERVLEGRACLQHIADLMRAGDWASVFFDETLETTLDTYRLGAELEPQLADRVPWYEARVRVMKEFELFTEARVRDGLEPPFRLNIVRFHRHGAEADLLVLLDEIKRSGAKAGAPIKREPFEFKLARPTWSAFPDLKPPIMVPPQVDPTDPDPDTRPVEKDLVPVPALPVLAAYAEPLLRARYQQLRAGLDQLMRVRVVMQIGSWTSQFLPDTLDMMLGTFRVGAEFETEPDKRVAWYRARIARLKGFEQFIEKRVRAGDDRPHRLCLVRLARLRAEAELLQLAAKVSRAPGDPAVVHQGVAG